MEFEFISFPSLIRAGNQLHFARITSKKYFELNGTKNNLLFSFLGRFVLLNSYLHFYLKNQRLKVSKLN